MIANTTVSTLIDWNLINTSSTALSPPIFANASVAAFTNLLYTPNSVELILNGTTATAGTTAAATASSTSISPGGNNSFDHNGDDGGTYTYPAYMRTTSMVFCIAIMCLGVIGNVMVPIVIFKTKDMRNSTNIFLVNLSVADLMVLLVCTPTVLVEVNAKPEVWVLGEEMCKAVPFVELTVAHASVLTILAISFERYYAICKPLKAGYICTKARASLICLLAWIIAAIFTSPMLAITKYSIEEYYDGTFITACFSQVDTFLPALFFILSITIFFFVPLAILIILYALIAKALMQHPNMMAPYKNHCHIPSHSVIKYRKQVVLMLGTVVLAFFICLLPFRALVLWIIVVPADSILKYGLEEYWNILYFCRIMFHINSAINPILYNIMSSKFRGGFFRLCGLRRLHAKYRHNAEINRKNTFNTSSLQNSSQQTSESFWNRYSSHHKHHRYSGKEAAAAAAKEELKNNNRERNLKECYVRAPLRAVEGVKTSRMLLNGESYV